MGRVPFQLPSRASILFNELRGEGYTKVDGEVLSNLRFADDIMLADFPNQMMEILNELVQQGQVARLEIIRKKLNYFQNRIVQENTTKISRTKVENVTEVTYLGKLISIEDRIEKEMNRRIALSWNKF